MEHQRRGTTGLELSEVGLGTFEWGHRVDARAAQRLVDEYSGAGGNVIELPSSGDSSAEVISQLRLPDEILMMARVGVSMREPDRIDVGLGRSRVLSQVESLLTLGKIRYVGVSHHTGWQLAEMRGAGVPIACAVAEYSLLNREAEDELIPAADYAGVGLIAGASLGRGVLTDKYRSATPQ